MANKEKKRKDKKRRQRRERKGKLPSSVEALLGYLGGGAPMAAPQGDTKPRERAGYDAYDTLHQIIKSQQIQSANYMANLERMAFKTEITNQLKQQGEESKKALEDTKAQVAQTVEKVARSYTKKTPEEKIQEYQSQIEWQMRRGDKRDSGAIAAAQKGIQKYQGIIEFRQSSMPPAASVEPTQITTNVRAGGDGGAAKINVASATGTTQLPATDPIQGFLSSKLVSLSPISPQPSRAAEIQGAKALFNYSDDMSSSLEAKNVGKRLARQSHAISNLESQVFGGAIGTRSKTGAAAAKK